MMFSRPFTSHSYRSRSSLHSSFRDSMRGTNIRLTATRVALDRNRGIETRADGNWHKASFLSGSRSDSHSSSADVERGNNRNQLQVPRAGRPLYTASFRSHRRRRSDMEDSFSSSWFKQHEKIFQLCFLWIVFYILIMDLWYQVFLLLLFDITCLSNGCNIHSGDSSEELWSVCVYNVTINFFVYIYSSFHCLKHSILLFVWINISQIFRHTYLLPEEGTFLFHFT